MNCPYCNMPITKRRFFKKYMCGTPASKSPRRTRACLYNQMHRQDQRIMVAEAKAIEATAAQKELERSIVEKLKMLDGVESIPKLTDKGLTLDLHCGIFTINLKGATLILAKDGVEVWRG